MSIPAISRLFQTESKPAESSQMRSFSTSRTIGKGDLERSQVEIARKFRSNPDEAEKKLENGLAWVASPARANMENRQHWEANGPDASMLAAHR